MLINILQHTRWYYRSRIETDQSLESIYAQIIGSQGDEYCPIVKKTHKAPYDKGLKCS